jgi:hypothetical protein
MMRQVLVILLMALSVASFAQQDHFLYLQSEDRQPFYAKISSQVFSSSENGYLIVPKLADGVYQVDVGFPRAAFPEQHFVLQVNKKDQGFQLKNLGQKGWGLYSLRNGEMLENKDANQAVAEFSGTKKTDPFSAMLANIVNDSAILYSAVKTPPPTPKPEPKTEVVAATNPPATVSAVDSTQSTVKQPEPVKTEVAKTEVVKTETTTPVSTDSAQEKKSDPPVAAVKPASEIQPVTAAKKTEAPSTEKPFISKISEATTSEAYSAVFLEQYNLSTDTVRISIPLKEESLPPTSSAPVISRAADPVVTQSTTTVQSEVAPAAPVVKTETRAPKKTTLQVFNSDCKNFASDVDVDKLRVKIIAEYAIEDKLLASKKVFKQRCFTVKQIRALTELFPSDETKYQFFDAAYPFVYDTSDFYLLEDLLKNDYYKNRFKAMIHR